MALSGANLRFAIQRSDKMVAIFLDSGETTAIADIKVYGYEIASGDWYDSGTGKFDNAVPPGVAVPAATELNAANFPGIYLYEFPSDAAVDDSKGYIIRMSSSAQAEVQVLFIHSAEVAPSLADIADSVWDEALAGHVGGGSTGEKLDDLTVPPTVGDIADQVWDEATAGHVGAGSFGKLAADIPDDVADQVWDETMGSHVGVGTTGARLDDVPTVGETADQVWDEAVALHAGVGSTGEALGLVPTANDIADQVWDEILAGHVGAGSTGEALTDLPGNVWEETVAAHTSPGTMGDELDDLSAWITASEGNITAWVDNSISVAQVSIEAKVDAGPGLVWDQIHSLHLDPLTTGLALFDVPEETTDQVWDEALADHLGAGSMGEALDDADATADPLAVADAVWDEALSGHTTPGTGGDWLRRTAALRLDNMRISYTSHDTAGRPLTGTVYIYGSKADADADAGIVGLNSIGQYDFEQAYDVDGKPESYLSTREA